MSHDIEIGVIIHKSAEFAVIPVLELFNEERQKRNLCYFFILV